MGAKLFVNGRPNFALKLAMCPTPMNCVTPITPYSLGWAHSYVFVSNLKGDGASNLKVTKLIETSYDDGFRNLADELSRCMLLGGRSVIRFYWMGT